MTEELRAVLNAGVRSLFFNGQFDLICNHVRTNYRSSQQGIARPLNNGFGRHHGEGCSCGGVTLYPNQSRDVYPSLKAVHNLLYQGSIRAEGRETGRGGILWRSDMLCKRR